MADDFIMHRTVSLLRDGDSIQGVYLGEGDTMEKADPKTGEVKQRRSWLIAGRDPIDASPVIFKLLGAQRIDEFMSSIPCSTDDKQIEVKITRTGQVRLPDGRVSNQYAFGTRGALHLAAKQAISLPAKGQE